MIRGVFRLYSSVSIVFSSKESPAPVGACWQRGTWQLPCGNAEYDERLRSCFMRCMCASQWVGPSAATTVVGGGAGAAPDCVIPRTSSKLDDTTFFLSKSGMISFYMYQIEESLKC